MPHLNKKVFLVQRFRTLSHSRNECMVETTSIPALTLFLKMTVGIFQRWNNRAEVSLSIESPLPRD